MGVAVIWPAWRGLWRVFRWHGDRLCDTGLVLGPCTSGEAVTTAGMLGVTKVMVTSA